MDTVALGSKLVDVTPTSQSALSRKLEVGIKLDISIWIEVVLVSHLLG